MLKKIFFAVLLSSSSLSFATSDLKLIITPKGGWSGATHYAEALINNKNTIKVFHNKYEVIVSKGDEISIVDVAMMNVHPKIDTSCRSIHIQGGGKHQLVFDLQKDWIIYCQYS